MGHASATLTDEKFEFSAKAKRFTIILMVVGALLTGLGIFLASGDKGDAGHKDHHTSLLADHTPDHKAEGHDAHQPDPNVNKGDHPAVDHTGDEHKAGHDTPKHWTGRVWGNLLLNSYFFMLLAIAGTVFIAIHYLANAGWATTILRIPEAMGNYLPVAIITLLLVIVAGKDVLYKWMDPEVVAGSHLLQSKTWFLNSTFFYIVGPAILLIWLFFHYQLRKLSLQEDLAEKGTVKFFDASIKYSAIFMFFFAFSFSAMSWLLVMSVEAEWFSTIFSINQFAISWVSGIATIALIVIYLKSKGYLQAVTEEHLHDLGKFVFAFSIFWAYTWLSQYLLIWYANLPEEVAYYKARAYDSHFGIYFWTVLILCFFVPFLGLMMRNAKRNPVSLAIISGLVIFGHWLDLFVIIHPATTGNAATFGWMEIGSMLLFGGAFIFLVLSQIAKKPLYRKNHPYILESVKHDTGV